MSTNDTRTKSEERVQHQPQEHEQDEKTVGRIVPASVLIIDDIGREEINSL